MSAAGTAIRHSGWPAYYVDASCRAGTLRDMRHHRLCHPPLPPTDPTATPFRMFGAHCVALRLSLNVLPVFDQPRQGNAMKQDPESEKGRNVIISSVRHDEGSARQLNEILNSNPLYRPSAVLRGAILALYEMDREQQLAIIMKAAASGKNH